MCLTPLSLYSPSRVISLRGGQQLKLNVSCGHCAHCLIRKRDEYSFRTYWHTKECIDNGGYVYFFTLTYDNKHLPKLSHFIDIKEYNVADFSCFNREHYKLFFKRLRRRFDRKYPDVKFTYFLSTEYGDDDRFTHRPHYHILLFVNNKKLHPFFLSRIINLCWQYGRTDGLPYKKPSYVAKHVYGYDLGYGGDNTDTWILRAVTHYVAKYINKSIKFQSELDKRISQIEFALIKRDDCVDIIKSLKSCISMFHMQSQRYGLGYLSYLGNKERVLLEFDKCCLPDKNKVVKELPLPMYYMRKLYYEVVKKDDKRYWHLTEFGKQHKIKRLFNNISNQVERYESLYLSLSPDKKSHVTYLLNGRSLYDLVLYNTFYRGRLRSHTSYNLYFSQAEHELYETEELDMSWIDVINHSYDSLLYHVTSCAYVDDFKDVYVTNYISDYVDPCIPFFKIDRNEFIDKYTFNQTSSLRFKDFDVLNDFFDRCVRSMNSNAQSTYDNKVELSEKLKHFTNLTFN